MALIQLRPTQETIDLVAALRGIWHGTYAMCCCPVHDDRRPSLSIRQGTAGILVHCFAGCSPADIMRALRQLQPVSHTISQSHRRPLRGLTTSLQAQSLWTAADPVRGTLAEKYLAGRRLPIDLADIRFHPKCPLGRMPHTRYYPALLVGVREAEQIVAVQRIVLDPRSGHHRGKFLLGPCRQGAWQPPVRERALAIAEGFEDAAAFSYLHNITCWAALGASRLAMLQLPEQIDTLIIAEDNDVPGRLAAEKAVLAYASPRLAIIRMRPEHARDWTEAIKAAGF